MADGEQHLATCGCGQLRVTALGEPNVVTACNCVACQRRTGSPFSVGAYFKRDQIVSTEGSEKRFDRTVEGRNIGTRFCPQCGTSVYWTLDLRPNHIGIALGCFADPAFAAPKRIVWAESQHHWVRFPDGLPSFPKAAPLPPA